MDETFERELRPQSLRVRGWIGPKVTCITNACAISFGMYLYWCPLSSFIAPVCKGNIKPNNRNTKILHETAFLTRAYSRQSWLDVLHMGCDDSWPHPSTFYFQRLPWNIPGVQKML